MDTKSLIDLGLTHREIAVYISLVKLGSTTTGPLIKDSNVPSAKIYEVLEKLSSKGLITHIVKGQIKHFQAVAPSTLINFFEEKKASLKETVAQLEVLKKEPQSQAIVYEGISAIKSAFYEMYDSIGANSEYCVFPIGEQLDKEELVQFWAQVFRKRVEMKIKIRTLPNIRWQGIFEKFYKKYKFIEIRYTNQQLPTGVFIFKDCILSIIWGEKPVAFMIKSKINYLQWQKFFDELWEKGKF